jgi:hypothetical protein
MEFEDREKLDFIAESHRGASLNNLRNLKKKGLKNLSAEKDNGISQPKK